MSLPFDVKFQNAFNEELLFAVFTEELCLSVSEQVSFQLSLQSESFATEMTDFRLLLMLNLHVAPKR